MGNTTIKEDESGRYIYLYVRNRPKAVKVLSRTQRLKCKHKWGSVAMRGHGRWGIGCSKCGALARG